jgi:hypothetical protein
MNTESWPGDAAGKRSRYLRFGAPVVVLIVLFVFCSGCGYTDFYNPARRSHQEIRAEILAATPLGTDIGQVQAYIHSRWGKHGSGFQEPRSTGKDQQGISTEYGSPYYQFPHDVLDLVSPVEVSVCWFFDEQGRLDEVRVDKHQTGP